MAEEIRYLSVDVVKSFIKDVFMKMGVPEEDAETSSKVLIESDLRGIQSHGVGRLRYYYIRLERGQHNPITNIEIVRESPATAVIDGHHGMGMVVATRAMQMAIDKAKKYGIGSVAVRNSTHFGIAGYYPTMAVEQDMIGFAVTNARPSSSPTFGVTPLLGTNPIAFGAPTNDEFPFLYDGATTISQQGKIEVLARAEKPVPVEWSTDQDGNPITDPATLTSQIGKGMAALLPLGGTTEKQGSHKGYGLSTMVEILSASLQTGTFLTALRGIDKDGNFVPFRVGHFFMAMNIDAFCPIEEFKTTTSNILAELRSSRKAPGHDRIYTAGEKEYETAKTIRAQGVPINPNLQKDLLFLKEKLGLSQYDFPF